MSRISDEQVQQLLEQMPALQPWEDEHNQTLAAQTHPADWRNPEPRDRYDVVVIGAGSGGLVTAAGSAGLGARVALVERGLMGGDCLNVGCVPSKALIRCARAAAAARQGEPFGVRVRGEVEVDFNAVMRHVRGVRAAISPHDSARRFADLGIDVFLGDAAFASHETVRVGEAELRFAKAVIATGTRPSAPPIPGLEEAGFLTNETVFSLTELPPRLAVIGAGPIGCELAQAFARLGSQVTLIEAMDRILPREDADAAEVVAAALQRDGIRLICGGKAAQVERHGDERRLIVECAGERQQIDVDEILIGVGRQPNVESLNLDAAGVAFDERKGVHVDDYLRTANARVYAVGDVCSPYRFTHAADAMARMVIQNALFFGRKKVSQLHMPWCTYSDPEVAHVGLYEAEARERGVEVHTITVPLGDVDRAKLDGETEGFFRVHLKQGTDRILGATLVSPHAGETISEVTAMMTAGKGLGTLGNTIHPYPTQAEAIKRAADAYNRSRLTPTVKRVLETVLKWRRR